MRLSVERFKVLRELSGKLTHREKIVYGVGAATVVAVGAVVIAVVKIAKVSRNLGHAHQSDDDWPLGI
jgi:cell division protein FtsL